MVPDLRRSLASLLQPRAHRDADAAGRSSRRAARTKGARHDHDLLRELPLRADAPLAGRDRPPEGPHESPPVVSARKPADVLPAAGLGPGCDLGSRRAVLPADAEYPPPDP